MGSLQARLALSLGLSLIIIFAVVALLMNHFPRYLTEEYIISRLEHDADSIQKRLVVTATEAPTITGGPVAPIYRSPQSGHYFQIESQSGRLLSDSLSGFQLALPAVESGDRMSYRSDGPQQRPLLVWMNRTKINNQKLTILVAEDTSHIDEDIAEFRWKYLIGVLVTLLLLLASQSFIIRKSFRPIDQARRELKKIADGEASMIETVVPAEVTPMVDEINRLTGTMRKNLERSRNSLGNLAHSLKTPLAVISQVLETPESFQDTESRDELIRQNHKINQTVEKELRRARLSGNALPGQKFNLQDELPPLITMLERVHANRGIKITLDSPAMKYLTLDRADMLELIGNLLDNACKWADNSVHIQIYDDTGLHFTIEDDGPGIASEDLEKITQRGQRMDESTPGHGLGLSITREIVAEYQGKIHFRQSETLGGLLVEVDLISE